MNAADAIVGLGARGDFVATVPLTDVSRLRLTDEERLVFAHVGRAAMIAEVISRSGLPEPRAIAVLLSLRAKGAIAPARVTRPAGVAQPLDAALQENIDLEESRKREILEMERSLEYANHFDILGVPPDASADDVRRAYHELSRKYHPDRYFKKNLGSYRARVEKIFKRLTEANNTLGDPQRRKAYLAAHPELAQAAASGKPGGSEEPLSPERTAERKARLAMHPYLLRSRRGHQLLAEARVHLAANDYQKALLALEQAERMDTRTPEIQQLQQQAHRKAAQVRAAAEMQRGHDAEMVGNLAAAAAAYRNALALDDTNARAAGRGAALMIQLGEDIREAKHLAQRAVELEPTNAAFRMQLAKLLLDAGHKKLAKKEFEEVLKHEPENGEAKAQLRKLRWTF